MLLTELLPWLSQLDFSNRLGLQWTGILYINPMMRLPHIVTYRLKSRKHFLKWNSLFLDEMNLSYVILSYCSIPSKRHHVQGNLQKRNIGACFCFRGLVHDQHGQPGIIHTWHWNSSWEESSDTDWKVGVREREWEWDWAWCRLLKSEKLLSVVDLLQ